MFSCMGLLGCLAVVVVPLLLLANDGLTDTLSPQGCRMSYMSPSYVLMDRFNASWTRLSTRYSLWLYREVGWDSQVRSSGYPFQCISQPIPRFPMDALSCLFPEMPVLPIKFGQ